MAMHARCRKPRNVDVSLSYLMMSLLKPPFSHPKNLSTQHLPTLQLSLLKRVGLPLLTFFFLLMFLGMLALIPLLLRYLLIFLVSYAESAITSSRPCPHPSSYPFSLHLYTICDL